MQDDHEEPIAGTKAVAFYLMFAAMSAAAWVQFMSLFMDE